MKMMEVLEDQISLCRVLATINIICSILNTFWSCEVLSLSFVLLHNNLWSCVESSCEHLITQVQLWSTTCSVLCIILQVNIHCIAFLVVVLFFTHSGQSGQSCAHWCASLQLCQFCCGSAVLPQPPSWTLEQLTVCQTTNRMWNAGKILRKRWGGVRDKKAGEVKRSENCLLCGIEVVSSFGVKGGR